MNPFQRSLSPHGKLEVIDSRMAEIRTALEAPDADLDALEAEITELTESRQRILKTEAVLNGGRVIRSFDGSDFGDSTTLRAVGLGDDLRSAMRPASGPNLAAVVRGLAIGDWSHMTSEQRALISTGAAAAIPGASVLAIVEQAMAQSAVFRAGARVVNIDRPTEKIARIVSTGTAEWRPDTADRDLTDQTIVVTAEDLVAHSAFLYSTCSIESLEDATGLEDAIVGAFSRQLGLLYDQAAIAGTGTNMPKGIGAMSTAVDGICEITAVGDIHNHSGHMPFVRAAGEVLGMNHTPSSVMIDTDTWTTLATNSDDVGRPILAPKAYTDMNELVSNFLPHGTAIVADWSKWLFGTRTNITLEISRTGDGFKKGMVEIRAFVRFGGIPVDPSAFCLMSGIEHEAQVS